MTTSTLQTPPLERPARPRQEHRAATRTDRVLSTLSTAGLPALRITLAVIYVWFGALKLADVTPVAELVRNTVPVVDPPSWFVPALGDFEIVVGLWLLSGRRLRLLLPLLVAHLLGTFGVLVLQPGIAFQHGNPLELSVVGEFVVKNLILLTAGVVVCMRPTAGPRTDRG